MEIFLQWYWRASAYIKGETCSRIRIRKLPGYSTAVEIGSTVYRARRYKFTFHFLVQHFVVNVPIMKIRQRVQLIVVQNKQTCVTSHSQIFVSQPKNVFVEKNVRKFVRWSMLCNLFKVFITTQCNFWKTFMNCKKPQQEIIRPHKSPIPIFGKF